MDVAKPRPTAASLAAVIPAHNAAATIGTAIAGLDGVGDIVVVDDGSTDDTAEVASAHGARVIRHDTATGPAAARNTGIRHTDAPVILVLDADAAPEAGWLEPLLAHLGDPKVCGAAPRVRAPAGTTALGRYEAVAGPLDLGADGGLVQPDGPVPFVSTTALVLRRSAWEQVGGFSEDLRFGEDLDLAWRLAKRGEPLVYEPASTVWHPHRPTLRDHLVNRFRYGTASGPLARRHGLPRAAVAPPLLSAAFVAGVLGCRRVGAGLVVASLAGDVAARRRTAVPTRRAVSGAVRGHLAASRGLAAAVSRPWLPIALVTAVVRRRSRLPLGPAVLARSMFVRRAARSDLPLGPCFVLRALDDLAYSAGVIRSCVTSRVAGPLLPTRRLPT